jgi:aldose 1-epimerase
MKKNKGILYHWLFLLLMIISNYIKAQSVTITASSFGKIGTEELMLFTIKNTSGYSVSLINYGASIQKIIMPDKKGAAANVNIGFDDIAGYTSAYNSYLGSVVGRFANRIANGAFTLDGVQYKLPQNAEKNCIHGGPNAMSFQIWKVEKYESNDTAAMVTFSHLSADGHNGFPGNVQIFVSYTLNHKNELTLYYKAFTDKTTIINLTNHAYFNLNENHQHTALNHILTVKADKYVALNKAQIPTGKLLPLRNKKFDLKKEVQLRKIITSPTEGLDYAYVLSKNKSTLQQAATLYEPASGRYIEMYTTEPSVQIYTANHFNSTFKAHNNIMPPQYGAVCMEAQHFPDSPNQPTFPSTILKPGEIYQQTTIYKLGVK